MRIRHQHRKTRRTGGGSAYHLPRTLPFTLTFEPELVPTPMNYADHILPQHQQHISDDPSDFCRQVLTDGYLAPD